MRLYRLQGIHCSDCGERLQRDLRRLKNGEDVHLDYTKNQLSLPKDMDPEEVRMILANEKIIAFPEEEMTDHDHDTGHGHNHGHTHSHINLRDPGASVKNIRLVFFLNLIFSVSEVFFGLMFNSMAILSDAVHDFGDSVSVGLSWFFESYSKKEPSKRFSFGHQRFSLMGALITATVLLIGSVILLTRSVPRLLSPEPVNAEGMLYVAIAAILVNGYAAWLLSRGTSQNEKVLNVHMMEDLLGWIGVLIVSIILRFTDWYFLDPLLSILISIYIFIRTVPLFVSTLHIFLEGVPPHVDLNRLEVDILKIESVHAVSHLHIWSIDGEENAMNVTLFLSTEDAMKIEAIKDEVKFLTKELRVSHSTIETISDMKKIISQN